MALFASLIIRLFQLVFQPEQCFSLTTNQLEQCFDLFFSESNGAMKVNFLDDVSDFSFAVKVTPLENTKHESFVLVTIL